MAEDQPAGKFEAVVENGKRVYKSKNPEDEREVKRWMVPSGYTQEFGKVLPDSLFFSDKSELRHANKSKIVKVQVWSDSAEVPAAFQFHYHTDQGKTAAGLTPFPLGELQEL